MTALQPGALHPDASGHADLGDAVLGDGPAEPLRVPTCVVLFITSHGLSRLKGWLRDEWARGGLRIITCVERLDSCFDFEAEDPLFGSEASDDLSWPIYTAHERDGVFVVPPKGVSVAEWAADEPSFAPRPPLTRGLADASEHAVVHALLSDADIATIVKLGEAALLAQAADAPDTIDLFASNAPTDAEDYFHNSSANAEHRVAHLHRDDLLQQHEGGRLLERVLSAVRRADAQHWRLLVGRPCSVRSAEYHVYSSGGSVADPEHRDQGSLLTLTALLTPPEACVSGGELLMATSADESVPMVHVALGRGDGCVFVSEKRHNVTRVAGARASFVVELWDGPPNTFNRHS